MSEHKTAEEILYYVLVTDIDGMYDYEGYTDYMSHGWKDQYLKAMELYSAQQVAEARNKVIEEVKAEFDDGHTYSKYDIVKAVNRLKV